MKIEIIRKDFSDEFQGGKKGRKLDQHAGRG